MPAARPRPIALLGLLLTVSLASHGCGYTRLLDKPWIEVRSDNFVVTSDMSAERARELASRLELFRAAVLRITGSRDRPSSVPTRVFFFDEGSSFRPFQTTRGVVGYFAPALRGNFVAIVDNSAIDAVRILRHEYVHFLMDNGSRRIYPPWYSEGFAELLSTVQPTGSHVTVGMVPMDRVIELKRHRRYWMPMSRVLAYDGRSGDPRTRLFYPASWALLHYLSRDVEHAVKLGPSVEVYLDAIESGSSIDEACLAAFGMSPQALDDRVREHLARGSFTPFGIRANSIPWSDHTETRVLTRAETAERLGELALAIERPGTAEMFLHEALAADPARPRPQAGIGAVLDEQGKADEARARFERAVELGPNDPLNHIDLGTHWIFLAKESESAQERRSLLERGRAQIRIALELDEWKPEPWAVLGYSYLRGDADPARAAEALEKALQLLPSNRSTQLWLAEAYIEQGRGAEARPMLERIASWSHGGAATREARSLLEKLDAEPSAQ